MVRKGSLSDRSGNGCDRVLSALDRHAHAAPFAASLVRKRRRGCPIFAETAALVLGVTVRRLVRQLQDSGERRAGCPIVYVDMITPKVNSGCNRRLALTPVANLLKAMFGEARYKQDQLREALNHFQSTYPRMRRTLRTKIEDLHRTSNEPAASWRQLFAAEARRRSH